MSIQQQFKRISYYLSIIFLLTGAIALFAWFTDIDRLKTLAPRFISVKVNTAICFLLAGITLLLLHQDKKKAVSGYLVSFFAIIIFLTGTLTLLEYIYNYNFGIDELLFKDDPDATETLFPGRQTPFNALFFLLFGFAFLPYIRNIKRPDINHITALLIGITAFVTFIAYMFTAGNDYKVYGYNIISFQSSFAFIFLAVAALFLRPRAGIMKQVSDDSLGGKLIRIIFPLSLFIFLTLGWLRLKGEREGLYGDELGLSLFIIVTVIVFTILLFKTAAILTNHENLQSQFTGQLIKANENLEKAEALTSLGSWEFDIKANKATWSKQVFRFFDLEPTDMAPSKKELAKFLYPDDCPVFFESLQQALRGQQPQNMVFRTNAAYLSARYLYTIWQIEFNTAGVPSRLYGTIQDITDTFLKDKKLKQSHDLFSKAFHSKVFGLAIVNSERRVVDINDTLLNLIGFKREDFIGKTADEIGLTANAEYTRKRDELLLLVMQQGRIDNEELEIITKAGKLLNLLLSVESLILNEEPHWLISLVDITARKKTEDALKEVEQRAHMYYENAAILIWEEDFSETKTYLQKIIDSGVKDLKSFLLINRAELSHAAGLIKVTSVNNTTLKFYKVENMEDLLIQLPSCFLEDSWLVIADELDALMKGALHYESEIFTTTPDGVNKHLLLNLAVPPLYAKKLDKVMVSFVDITALKKAEADLAQSEIRFRKLTSNAPVAIFQTEANGDYTYVNEEWLKYSGMGFNEAMGRGWVSAIHPEDRERVVEAWITAVTTTNIFVSEYRFLDKNERITWLSANAVALTDAHRNIIGFIGTASDITVRKNAELNVTQSKEMLEAAEEQANMGSWEYEIESHCRVWSKQMYRLFNLDPAGRPPTNKEFLNFIHPDDLEIFFRNVDYLNKGLPTDKVIFRTNPQLLPLKYFEPTWQMESDREGKPFKVTGTLYDITQRVLNENKIKESESKYRTLVEQASDAILIVGPSLKYIEVNGMACKMLGYTREEFLQLSVQEITVLEMGDKPLSFADLDRGKSFILERKFKRKDESLIPVEISASMMDNGNYLAIIRDITERKKAQLLFDGEKRVMEMIATGKPLKKILNILALNYEAIAEKALCSILLVNEDGVHLNYGAGPSLPDVFNNAIDGEPIGPAAGSCGTAVYYKKRVIVSDIAADPLWAGYRELALAHNLRSCWSSPILNNENKVLATFAIYYREIREPSGKDLHLIDRSASQLKIALERHYHAKQIKDSEERYRTLVEQATDGIFIMDELGRFITTNSAVSRLSGYSAEELRSMTIFDFVFKEDLEKAPFHFAELEMGKMVTSERIMKTKGNKPVYVDIRAKLIADGRRLVFLRDITEHKKAEQEIEMIRKERDSALNRINDKVISVDTVWRYTFLNDAALAEHPLGREETLGKVIWDVHPEMKGTILEDKYRESMKNGTTVEIENYYEPLKVWFYIKVYPSADGLTVFYQDISEKKKAEVEIIRYQKQFQKLVENISGVYWVNNLETYQTVYISPSYESIWGRKCEDLYNNPADFINAVHPDDKAILIEARENIGGRDEMNIIYRIIRPDKQIRWISAKMNVITDSTGNKMEYGYAEDITEQKIAEKELAESENRLRTILEHEPECVKLLDNKGNVLDMNPAGLAMIEAGSLDVIKGKNVIDIVKEPYRTAFASLTKNVFKGNPGKLEFEITGLKGSSRWLETHAVPLKNSEGKIVSLLGVSRDITDRKKAGQEKELLTLRNQQTLDTMLDGFILADDTGKIIEVNPAYCKMIGYSREVLMQKNINELEASLSRTGVESRIAEMIEKKSVKFETRHRRKDGELIDMEVSISIMMVAEKPLVAAFLRDISARKRAEEQLNINNRELRRLTDHLHSIREEERRRIGREIHDDLGQQLTAIKMDVAWIDKNTEKAEKKIKDKLENILNLLDGSNQSVRRILSELKPSILDEYGLLDAIEMQSNQFTRNTGIPVSIKKPPEELKLSEDIAMCIFRVFQESLTNITRYAMAKKVVVSLKVNAGTIAVGIEDDGKGFDVISADGKKTFGILGMKERVRGLNGSFELTSATGKGTKIKIVLPVKNNIPPGF